MAEEAEVQEEEVAVEAAVQSATRVPMSRLSNCKAIQAWWLTRHFHRNPWPVCFAQGQVRGPRHEF